MCTDLDPRLGHVDPRSDLLALVDVRVRVLAEGGLQHGDLGAGVEGAVPAALPPGAPHRRRPRPTPAAAVAATAVHAVFLSVGVR